MMLTFALLLCGYATAQAQDSPPDWARLPMSKPDFEYQSRKAYELYKDADNENFSSFLDLHRIASITSASLACWTF
tara:strand:+ start:691 stop:918 length:228 start_codon:yes stop_codon:yes gene_type:complete